MLKKLESYLKRNNIKLTNLEKNLIKHEGFKLTFYEDTKGIRTIGIGHNCEANPLTLKQEETFRYATNEDHKIEVVLELLSADIKEASNGVYRVFGEYTRTFTHSQYDALVEMVFHMGIGSFMKFEKTIELIKLQLWFKAQLEALNSVWAVQFPKRANKVVQGFLK